MFRLLAAALLSVLSALAQSVMFQVLPPDAAAFALGTSIRDPLRLVLVTVALPPGSTAERVEILMHAPQIAAVRNADAIRYLDQRAASDARSTRARWAQGLLVIAPVGVQLGGWAVGDKTVVAAGLGIEILKLLAMGLQKRAPDPARFDPSSLLPDVAPRGQYYVLASVSPGVTSLGPFELRIK